MLLLKLIIMSIIITGFLVGALGLKMLFDKDADTAGQSCHIGDASSKEESACSNCALKNITKCDENPVVNGVVNRFGIKK